MCAKIPSKLKIRKREITQKNKDIAKEYKTMTKGKLQPEENNYFNGMTKATCTTDIKTIFFLNSLLIYSINFLCLKFTKEVEMQRSYLHFQNGLPS